MFTTFFQVAFGDVSFFTILERNMLSQEQVDKMLISGPTIENLTKRHKQQFITKLFFSENSILGETKLG